MNSLIRFFVVFATAFGLVATAAAQDHGTRDEAKAMAESAVAYLKKVGTEKALEDFSKDKANWTKKDLYVFAFDLEGVTRAHGTNEKLIGKSLLGLKDQNGKEFIKAMVEIAKGPGDGWVDYDWANPVSKKVENKTTFVKRVAGADLFVGVGAYR